MVDANPESCMRMQITLTTSRFRRFLHNDLAWDGRMSGPAGPRGVGKSTLFLQYARDHIQEERILYVSADNVYFSSHTLVELADAFSKGARQLAGAERGYVVKDDMEYAAGRTIPLRAFGLNY